MICRTSIILRKPYKGRRATTQVSATTLGRRIGHLGGEFFEFEVRRLNHLGERIAEEIRVFAIVEPKTHFV